MSRSKLFILTSAILFIAAACNRQPPQVQPAPDKPTGYEASFSGSLIAGGAECQLFQANDGKQYTLTGNLAGFKQGDVVNIKGTLQEISFCQQGDGTITVSTITHTDETAGWKTYTNADLSYSVSYPADWIVVGGEEEKIQPVQLDIDNGMPAVYFNVRIEDRSFENLRVSLKNNFSGRNVLESEIVLGGEKGFAYIEKSPVLYENGQVRGLGYEAIVQHNSKVYYVWTQKYNLDEVKQILSTFKFTK